MSHWRTFVLASCVGLFGAAFALHADQWNKRTILTVNEPIQVPGKTLEPGQYVMKLLDSPANRHIVQIYDRDGQHLITTVLAIPNYRLTPSGKTQFSFWETPAGRPRPLRSWFYPGDNFGQEFAYPKNEAMQIAAVVNEPVPTTYATSESDLGTARAGTVDKGGAEKELDQDTYKSNDTAQSQPPAATAPAPEPVQTDQNIAPAKDRDNTDADRAAAPPPAAAPPAATPTATTPPATTPESLPHTASPYPSLAVFGLLSIFGAAVLTLFARKA